MKYKNYDFDGVSICNCVRDAFFYKMWIDKDDDDWNVCETNSFLKLFIFIKTKMNDLTNWISSFTFISFINKNVSKDENENINFLIVKWWEALIQLIKIKSKKESFFLTSNNFESLYNVIVR